MPSSPELTQESIRTRTQAWEPVEVGSLDSAAAPAPAAAGAGFVLDPAPVPARFTPPAPVFELAAVSGIAPEVLAPARAAAEAAGYAAGWASGIQAARVVSETELHAGRARADRQHAADQAAITAALDAVRAAATALDAREASSAAHIEDLIVTSAFTIAEAIVGVSLRDDATRGDAAIARALALAPSDGPVVISLSPRDHATLTMASVQATAGREVELVADPRLQPGDATATCGATTIDARIAAGVARAHEVLAR